MIAPGELPDKIRRSLTRLKLEGAGLVVAVSGGPDSVALLHALVRLDVRPLVIAHVNHQLRGAESDADEQFVQELHRSLHASRDDGLFCAINRVDVASLAHDSGKNLEAVAREARYRLLAETARGHGLHHVATGHTADDQAETVLHHLLRGCGIQGLRGIAHCRPIAEGVQVVRPMLDVTRSEVLAFLQSQGLIAREDSTNADVRYTRNRIRHELLPYLEKSFNPAIREVLARLAHDADECTEEDQREARALLADSELPRAGPLLVFNLARLKQASRRRVRLLFREVWSREGWPTDAMSFEHWNRLEEIVFDTLSSADFPGTIHTRRQARVIQIGPSQRRGGS